MHKKKRDSCWGLASFLFMLVSVWGVETLSHGSYLLERRILGAGDGGRPSQS